ncbi:MAG TPA: DsbA family protein [Patescibacteria group bacterium]|nr:DsbA family protein [Patescibacteria group bacterium]
MISKKMLAEITPTVMLVTNILSTLSLVVIAMVAVLWWRAGGGFTSSTTSAPTAAAPSAPDAGGAAPVSQLSDAQWKDLLKNYEGQIGNKNAKITMVEFTDYQCPFCEQFFTNTLGQIKKNFIDTNKVNLEVHDYPLPFHPNAHIAAEFVRCGNEQGKFWQAHDALFSKQSEWVNLSDPKPKFQEYAGSMGANVSKLMSCVTSGKYKQAVDDDVALGNKVGVSGTPSFFVNGKLVVGALPYAQFETELNSAK